MEKTKERKDREQRLGPTNITGPWTPVEYADLYRVSRATVYNWFTRGLLDSVKIGGSRRILPEHDAAFRDHFPA